MKRLIVLILIISMLMIPTAMADESPMRKLTLEAAVSGEELDVYFYADLSYENATTAFESIDFELTYEKSVLELIESVKKDGGLESDVLDSSFIMEEATDTAGRYGLHAASAFGNAGTGLLLHLRFRIIGEGYYGFRLARDGYSVYDSAANNSQSYRFPRLDINAELPKNDTQLIASNEKTSSGQQSEQQQENGFMRFLRSIFGTSCSGGR